MDPRTQQGLMARGQEAFRAHQAAEKVRHQQQGRGKPIISLVHAGYRIVAVGNTVCWGKEWAVFPDFLFWFLKRTLGNEWGVRAQKEKSSHPIFRWFKKFQEYSHEHRSESGRVSSGPLRGFLAGILHLAYALYLIKHHDEVPKRLLRRLRDDVTFLPAYYETIVGAALAVAGLDISSAEKQATSKSTPEFQAISRRTKITYNVEAKRKDRWTAATTDVDSTEFQDELTRYVRGQIYNASRKKLDNPIFWFELSIPTLTTEADWRTIARRFELILRDAESMTVDGIPVAPAFVVITNHTFLANEDVLGDPSFAFLGTLCIADYPFGRAMEIEDALVGYDKYRDVFGMMEAWRVARTVPITFDGSPPELLSPDGEPVRTMQIGDTVDIPDPNGNLVSVRIEEIASAGKKAWVAVHHADSNQRWIAEVPLTEAEAQAAARYTDAVFGKSTASHKLREEDPFDLYDWILTAYAQTSPSQLDKLFREDGHLKQFEGLPPAEKRTRLAREYTKRIWVTTKMKGDTQQPPPTGDQ